MMKTAMKTVLSYFILKIILLLNTIILVESDTKLCTEWMAAENLKMKPISSSRRSLPFVDEEMEEDEDKALRNTTCIGDSYMITRMRIIMEKKENMRRKASKKEILVRSGKCYNKSTLIDVKFGNNILYSVCHNEDTDHTYYAKSYIDGKKQDSAETGHARPKFEEDEFFPSIHADKSYSKSGQKKSVEYLLGSKTLAAKYIKSSGNDYFARGHLFPNADPAAKVERDATFYYINTFPQWQPMNMGNWNQLEGAARKLAKSAKATLTIWSGTYGIMELPNEKNNKVQLWFGRDDKDKFVEPKRLPVPYLAWKIIHYEKCNQAIAIVQINNPWDNSTKPFCKTFCNDITWIKWDLTSRNKGYTFCCDATTFQSHVSFAPKIDKNVKLLKDTPKSKNC